MTSWAVPPKPTTTARSRFGWETKSAPHGQPPATKSFLAQELVDELVQHVVADDADDRVGLAVAMDDRGGRLIDVVTLAQRVILVDRGFERAPLDEGAHFGHFRWCEDAGNGAVHIAALLPLFLVLKQDFLDRLELADLRRGPGVLGGHAGMRVHRQRGITMDEVDLAGAHVVVHQRAVGRHEQSLAGRTLEIAEYFHADGGALGTKCFVRIDVGKGSGGLRNPGWRGGRNHCRTNGATPANARRHQEKEDGSGQNSATIHTTPPTSKDDQPLRNQPTHSLP